MATVTSIFSGRGFKAIETDSLELGQQVLQANRHEVGVVCEKGGKYTYGYTVIFNDGSECGSQQLDANSPFTRIELRDGLGIVSQDEVNRLIQLRDAKRVTDKWEREEAGRKKAEEIERIRVELREKYPWATSDNPSKNLKAELKQIWPSVKFSVRYKSFSGGDSITIGWTDGPSDKQVNRIASKYESGTFDAMTDCSGYDHSAYGSAVDSVLGRAKFVSTSRHYSDALIQKAIDRVITKFAVNIASYKIVVELTPEQYRAGKLWNSSPYLNGDFNRDSFQSLISQEVGRIGMMPKQVKQ